MHSSPLYLKHYHTIVSSSFDDFSKEGRYHCTQSSFIGVQVALFSECMSISEIKGLEIIFIDGVLWESPDDPRVP